MSLSGLLELKVVYIGSSVGLLDVVWSTAVAYCVVCRMSPISATTYILTYLRRAITTVIGYVLELFLVPSFKSAKCAAVRPTHPVRT